MLARLVWGEVRMLMEHAGLGDDVLLIEKNI